MTIGARLDANITSKKPYAEATDKVRTEEVRAKVTDVAYDEILRNYLNEFVPRFEHDILKDFINHENIRSNVIEGAKMEEIEKKSLNYLYRSGFIGTIDENGNQKFHPAAKSIYDLETELPKSDFYIIHPVLDFKLRIKITFKLFYNNHTIIGNGYHFYDPFTNYKNVLTKYSLAEFTPEKTPSDSLTQPNSSVRCKHPIKDIYKHFFYHENQDLKGDVFAKAFGVLSNIAKIRLLDKMDDRSNVIKRERLLYNNSLEQEKITLPYQEEIAYLNEDITIISNRIFGRLIVLGCIIYLKMDYNLINGILKYSNYPKRVTEKSTKYLYRSFFIHGLGTADPKLKLNNIKKIKLGMSNFEKQELEDWWICFTKHDLLMGKALKNYNIVF